MEYDLMEIPEINKAVKRYNRQRQIPTTYFTMIQDVYYDDHKIYLLVANDESEYVCNKICVLEIAKNIRHIATLELTGRVYESFCVRDNKLIASNCMNACLDIFAIQE
jgi:hypothetical protein